jgi:subtilisin family serine protease
VNFDAPICKVEGGWDFVNDDDNPMDDQGHGTHCAGIVAGEGDFNLFGYSKPLFDFKIQLGYRLELQAESRVNLKHRTIFSCGNRRESVS